MAVSVNNRPFVQLWMCCTNSPSRNLRLPHHKVPRRLHHLKPPSKRLAPHHTAQHVTRRPRHTINQSTITLFNLCWVIVERMFVFSRCRGEEGHCSDAVATGIVIDFLSNFTSENIPMLCILMRFY